MIAAAAAPFKAAPAISSAAVDPVKAVENEVKTLEDKEKALENEMKGAVDKVQQAKQAEAKMEGDVAKLEIEKQKRDAALKALEQKARSDEAVHKKLVDDEVKVAAWRYLRSRRRRLFRRKSPMRRLLSPSLRRINNVLLTKTRRPWPMNRKFKMS